MAATVTRSSATVDKALTDALRTNGVPKEALATAVSFVRDLSEKGIKPTRGFPKGTPPFWDIISVEAQIGAKQLSAILPLLQRQGVQGLKILINGIPDPDIYHLQFDLNVPR